MANKFVRFFAHGVIYRRNEQGKLTSILKTFEGSGVALDSKELYGFVFRQCPWLTKCDRVDVKTIPIN